MTSTRELRRVAMPTKTAIQLPLTPSSSVSSMDSSPPLEMATSFDEPVPPLELRGESLSDEDSVETALHVIETERDALANLWEIYKTNQVARDGFVDAVKTITSTINRGGRLIGCGVGKSAKIAQKSVATMNSLGIRCAFLHPTEALHGDLGMIGPNDTLLIVTFSGRTPELVSLLPHIPLDLPRIFISAHLDPMSCLLIALQPSACSILLPAPIPVPEGQSFGLAAPTTSTTVALALTDALALAVARHLHPEPSAVFRRYHPGGAIGASK